MRCRCRVLTRVCPPQDGWRPLHIAAQEGHPEVVKLLLEAGADVTETKKVRERSAGDGGLGVRTSRYFGEI